MGSKLQRTLLFTIAALLVGSAAVEYTRHIREARLGRPLITDGQPDADLADVIVGHTLPKPPSSPWLEARSRRYSGLLDGFKCDTLVLPIQVEGKAFDRPNREIMAADLALALKGGGHCVTDPDLMDLALGEGMRRRNPDEVLALARRIGATTIVTTYTGHSEGWIRITMQVARVDPGNPSAGLKVVQAHSITGFKFSETHPPFLCFREHLPEILGRVGLSQQPLAKTPGGPLPDELPASPSVVAGPPPGSAVAEAAIFMFLGMLAPSPESRASERLFTKAWVALEPVPEDDPVARLLRVRILYHLHERPYALSILDAQNDPPSQALRDLLKGNLLNVREGLAAAKTPWQRFFLGLEVHDLEDRYLRPAKVSANVVRDLFAGSPWQTLVVARLGDGNPQGAADTRPLGAFVDALSSGGGVWPALPAGTSDDATGGAESQLVALRNLHRLLEQQPARFCCSTFNPVVSAIDLQDVLDSRIEKLLLKQSAFQIETLVKTDAANNTLKGYDVELAGNPQQEQLRAEVQREELRVGQVQNRDQLIADFHAASYGAVMWEQGQTWASRQALWYLEQPPEDPSTGPMRAFGDDYPPRSYWNEADAGLETALAYSSDDAGALQRLTEHDPVRAPILLKELDTRFAGSPEATDMRLQHLAAADNRPEILRDMIAKDPDNWKLYKGLGMLLLNTGALSDIPGALLAYPSFHDPSPENSVALSDKAYIWGLRLALMGATEAAKPLYLQAASYKNGSASENAAVVALALIDRRYADAAAGYLDNARRYDRFYDYGEGLRLLFALDRSREAWSQFDQLTARFDAPVIWYSAIVGHRRAGLSEAELRKWLVDRTASIPTQGHLSVVRDAFIEQLTDRNPDPGLVPFMDKLDGVGQFEVHQDGRVYHAHPETRPINDVGPSNFGAFRRSQLSAGAEVPGRFALMTRAFALFRAENYTAAAQAFDQVAAYYYIEGGDTAAILPYFAFAEAQTGDPLQLRQFVDQSGNTSFEFLLARAVFSAQDGNYHRSADLLERASANWQYYDEDLDPAYVFLDICALLYESTHDERYRSYAINVARRVIINEPTASYAYAAIAYLGTDEQERTRALATALFLDAKSAWASKAPVKLQAKARVLLNGRSPFS